MSELQHSVLTCKTAFEHGVSVLTDKNLFMQKASANNESAIKPSVLSSKENFINGMTV